MEQREGRAAKEQPARNKRDDFCWGGKILVETEFRALRRDGNCLIM